MRVILAFLLLSLPLLGADYYVDFDSGSDANAGTQAAPFKHCPGDANATGTAASTTLSAGDTVYFKGGVRYYGEISLSWSGASGNHITYDGNSSGSWGTGKAIMDGTELISTSWTQCTDAADAGGNANFANIYRTTVPSGMTTGWNPIIVDGSIWTLTAQDPNPTNFFHIDTLSPADSTAQSNVTSTSLTDTTRFTQTDSTFWDEAWIAVHGDANYVRYREITSFNTTTDTVSWVGGVTINYDPTSYFVHNHPSLIDQAGEYAVNTADNRLYLWPPAGSNISTSEFRVGTRNVPFSAATANYITIKNFKSEGYFGDAGQAGYNGVFISLTIGTDIKVLDCDIKHHKSMERDRMITVLGSGDSQFNGNTVTDIVGSVMVTSGDGVEIMNNVFNRANGTGIYFQGTQNTVVENNRLIDIIGPHANGISVYPIPAGAGSDNVTLRNNYFYNCSSPLTYQDSSNLYLYGNWVDMRNQAYKVQSFGGMTGNLYAVGNTVINQLEGKAWVGGSAENTIFTNNIVDGGGIDDGSVSSTRSNNIFTARLSWQNAGAGWPGTGSSDQVDADLFTDPASDDWSLKAGSPAIDAGDSTTGASYLSGLDYLGTSRPQNSLYDIGAEEYVSGGGASTGTITTGKITIGP